MNASRLVLCMAAAFAVACTKDAPTAPNQPHVVVPVDTIAGIVMPALPRDSVDTHPADMPSHGTLRHVHAGDSLQAIINAAQPGDSIVLDQGAQFVGNYTLPLKSGASASQWITITTAGANVAEGTRMTPAMAASLKLASIATPNDADAVMADSGAGGYRLTGLDLTVTPAVSIVYSIVELLPTSQTVVLDHDYIHGTATSPIVRGVLLNGARDAVTDSYISDIHGNDFDSQAIVGYAGPGPYKIQNNYLEAAGETVMFGGADPTVPGQVPSDITIRGNHFYKPLSWGTTWTIKNLFELKDAVRVLVEGNILENCWAAGQIGNALLIQAVSQQGTAPWSTVTDVTVEYNYVTNATAGFYVNAATGSQIGTFPTQHTSRVLVANNVFDKIGLDPVLGTAVSDGNLLFAENDIHGLAFVHNTFIGASRLNSVLQVWNAGLGPVDSLVIRDNIMDLGDYGFVNLAAGAASPDVRGNVLFAHAGYPTGSAGSASTYPTSLFAASADSVGFANFAGGDYALLSTSPYKGKATDGKDPGADIATLNALLAGVR